MTPKRPITPPRRRKTISFDKTYYDLIDQLITNQEIRSVAEMTRRTTQMMLDILEGHADPESLVKQLEQFWYPPIKGQPANLEPFGLTIPREVVITVNQQLKLRKLKKEGVIKQEADVIRDGVLLFLELRNLCLKHKRMPTPREIQKLQWFGKRNNQPKK